MNNLILIIKSEEYVNDDAYTKVVNYINRISNKRSLPILCYGIWPHTCENVIEQLSYNRSLHSNLPDRLLWHFIISAPDNSPNIYGKYCAFADSIAKLFSAEYQICYACHTDTPHLHFHYVVSSTSYLPKGQPLDKSKMLQYVQKMLELAGQNNIVLERKE